MNNDIRLHIHRIWYIILFLNALEINRRHTQIRVYSSNGDMNLSSGIGILPLYYLCRPMTCPLGFRLELLAWSYRIVYMEIFCIHILERKESFQIFIKLRSVLNINCSAHIHIKILSVCTEYMWHIKTQDCSLVCIVLHNLYLWHVLMPDGLLLWEPEIA